LHAAEIKKKTSNTTPAKKIPFEEHAQYYNIIIVIIQMVHIVMCCEWIHWTEPRKGFSGRNFVNTVMKFVFHNSKEKNYRLPRNIHGQSVAGAVNKLNRFT
jgi:hypothetical protein